jgi:hypothetical protein
MFAIAVRGGIQSKRQHVQIPNQTTYITDQTRPLTYKNFRKHMSPIEVPTSTSLSLDNITLVLVIKSVCTVPP